MSKLAHSSRQQSNLKASLLARGSVELTRDASELPVQLIQTMGDNSFPYRKQMNLFDFFAQITSRFPILRPENKWLLAWHFLVLIGCMYYIFEIGLLWGYGIAVWVDQLAVLYVVNCIFILVFIADCFLSNIKAYYSHGLLVTHRRLIVKRYLKWRFYIDVIAILSICIPFISGKFVLNWIKALFFLKFYTVYEIDKEFIRVSQLKISYHTFYLLSRLVLLLYLGSHYLGIWFYMVDYWVYENNYYGPNTPNICWIYNAMAYSQIVLLLPWYGQYLYTMYFSIGTMTTIAYGDITPLNPLEVLYITIALIAYTIGFAYILSQILRILMEAQASKFEHSNNLLIVSNLMKNNRIKQKTQSKVKSYFQKVWKEEIYRNREVENQLIQKLPHKIRNQLFSELYESFFQSLGLYYIGCEPAVKSNFLVALANQIREQRLVQDHVLYKQFQQYDAENMNNHLIYFIKQLKKGKLKPSIEIGVRDIVIETITEGNFGVEGFLTGDRRDHWARVILSVLVYELPRKSLEDNLHLASDIEMENLFMLSETVYNKFCYICKQSGHNFKSCRFVTYQPNKSQLIKSYLSSPLSNLRMTNFGRSPVEIKFSHFPFAMQAQAEQNEPKRHRISYNTLIIHKEIKNIKYKIKHKYQMMMSNKYYQHLFAMKMNKKRHKESARDDGDVSRTYSSHSLKKYSRKLTNRLDVKMSPPSNEQIMIQKQTRPQFLQSMKKDEYKLQIQKHIHRASSLVPLHIGQEHRKRSAENEILQIERQNSETSEQSSMDSSSEESVDLQNYMKETQLFIQHLEKMDESNNENRYQLHDRGEADGIQFDVAREYQLYYPMSNLSQMIKQYNSAKKSKSSAQASIINRGTLNKMGRAGGGSSNYLDSSRGLMINQDEQESRSSRTYSMHQSGVSYI